MRFLIILCFFFFASACSTTPPDIEPKPDVPKLAEGFLTLDQIEKLFDQEKEDRIEFNKETVERYQSLVPLNKMFEDTPQKLMDLKVQSFATQEELPILADLRPFDTGIIRNQWNGTCTAHAITAVTEVVACSTYNLCKYKLSERHAWSLYQRYSSIAAINALLKYRVADDSYWPHANSAPKQSDASKFSKIKLKKVYQLNSEESIKTFLKNKKAINIAMTVPSQMISCSPVIKKTSKATDGGHALAVVGYVQSQKHGLIAILKNSWGKSCGDKGYQYMQVDVCKNEGFYCTFHAVDELDII